MGIIKPDLEIIMMLMLMIKIIIEKAVMLALTIIIALKL